MPDQRLRLASIEIDPELPDYSEGLALATESLLWEPLPPDPSAGRGISIVLLGLAIDPRHPCLRGRIYETPQLHPSSAQALALGNALASLINGRGEAVRGIAPRARVSGLSLPLADSRDELGAPIVTASSQELAQAVDYALQLAPRIILLPFESERDHAPLAKSIAKAAAMGVIVLAPAGAAQLDHAYAPARLAEVLAVTEGDDWARFPKANACASSALRAPNRAPVATKLDAEGMAQGPLVALALAAGVIAALWSLAPSLQREALLRVLRSGRGPLQPDLIDRSLPIDLAAWVGALDPDGQALLIHEPQLLPLLAPPDTPRELRLGLENCGLQRIEPSIELHDDKARLLSRIPAGPLLPGERRELSTSLTLEPLSKPRVLTTPSGTELIARVGALSLNPAGFPGAKRWTAALRLSFADCELVLPQLRALQLTVSAEALTIKLQNIGTAPIRRLRIELFRLDRSVQSIESPLLAPARARTIELSCRATGELEELTLHIETPEQLLQFSVRRHWQPPET